MQFLSCFIFIISFIGHGQAADFKQSLEELKSTFFKTVIYEFVSEPEKYSFSPREKIAPIQLSLTCEPLLKKECLKDTSDMRLAFLIYQERYPEISYLWYQKLQQAHEFNLRNLKEFWWCLYLSNGYLEVIKLTNVTLDTLENLERLRKLRGKAHCKM